ILEDAAELGKEYEVEIGDDAVADNKKRGRVVWVQEEADGMIAASRSSMKAPAPCRPTPLRAMLKGAARPTPPAPARTSRPRSSETTLFPRSPYRCPHRRACCPPVAYTERRSRSRGMKNNSPQDYSSTFTTIPIPACRRCFLRITTFTTGGTSTDRVWNS